MGKGVGGNATRHNITKTWFNAVGEAYLSGIRKIGILFLTVGLENTGFSADRVMRMKVEKIRA
jgi:hypothetical protein